MFTGYLTKYPNWLALLSNSIKCLKRKQKLNHWYQFKNLTEELQNKLTHDIYPYKDLIALI